MLAFVKVQDDIINLNDIQYISIFKNSIDINFLSDGNKISYTFDDEDEAKGAMSNMWYSMKLLKVAN